MAVPPLGAGSFVFRHPLLNRVVDGTLGRAPTQPTRRSKIARSMAATSTPMTGSARMVAILRPPRRSSTSPKYWPWAMVAATTS